jgi:two-component system, NarL family, sensor kinase
MSDVHIIFITFVGTIILLFITLILSFFFLLRSRQLKIVKERLLKVEVQEKTFQLISREIHDNIGQLLSLVKLNLNTIDIQQSVNVCEKISDTKELVSQAINEVRDLSKSLNSNIVKQIGLQEAIKRELNLATRTGLFRINFNQIGDYTRTNDQKELVVFRIFQETLNNIFKHANAKTISLQLEYIQNHLKLTISDDGKGFDASKLEKPEILKGLGVQNMYTRAKAIGAELQMTSVLNQGTTVMIGVPL